MCQEGGTNHWHRLVPDQNGSYVNGQWDPPGKTIADMPNGTDTSGSCAPCTYSPTFYGSAVLADGRVLVIGGEYNSNGKTWTNIGFLYNPVANTWSSQITEPFGTGNVGDTQTVSLPDGTLLMANISNTNIASLNPNTNPPSFTALNPTNKADRNDEEGWNILPDGTVLAVDASTASQFEIYDPATNSWTRGATPVNLADIGAGTGNSQEVGPGVLRPDGTLVYFSGNPSGQNAVYDTIARTWSHTADFPLVPMQTYHYSVADGPATLLPNGNVLVMASPVTTSSPFNTPSHFFEFDGTNLTQVADAPNASSFKSYQGNFLVLPTGEALLAAWDQGGTATLAVYSNGGGPQSAWRPVITSGPTNVNPSATYSISGHLFNGFSQGATYGDNAQMSTNYPLVRITNKATGHVFYARTHDHSRMGVEPVGSSIIVTTQFDAPAGLESGPSDLVVIANGIASEPIDVNGPDLAIAKTHSPALFTQGDAGDTFTITVSNIGASPTSGTVTVTDTLPTSLTAISMSGSGWTCVIGTVTCTRGDALAAGASYPAITIIVSVANDAPISVTNTAHVSGGGQGSGVNHTHNTAVDAVSIRQHTTTTVQPASGDFDDFVTLKATVSPAGITGSVGFFVNGSPVGLGSYNSTTGQAMLTYLIPLPAGSYSLGAAFTSSNVLYLDSSQTLPAGLTVTLEETTLSYTGDTVIANGGTATMKGVLLEDGVKPIVGRKVVFTLGSGGSAQTCSGFTDPSGTATCPISPVVQPLGPGVVADAFTGDAFYRPASASATTIMFAFLDSGAFSVGDQSAQMGADVTFWDAEWASINALSGGAAPESFKGFASTLTAEPPTCAITWTTSPGNSSDPPDTVPSFMGIVVPTSVGKSGSTIAGDVVRIVVVQTNDGYAPNPGHAGTGKIVAQFCHQ